MCDLSVCLLSSECWCLATAYGLEQSKGSDTSNDSDNLSTHGDDVSGTLEGGSWCRGGSG